MNEFITQVSDSIPFDNSTNGFIADRAQTAIEEAKATGGVARYAIPLVQNGTVGNNDWISYSNLTPDAKIVFPRACIVEEFSWSNSNSSVDFDLEFYKNGITSGDLYRTYQVRSSANDFDYETGWNDSFNAGDWIRILYKDQGTNLSDACLVLYIRNT